MSFSSRSSCPLSYYDRAFQRWHVASPPSSSHPCPSLSHTSLCRQLHRRTGSSSELNPMTRGSSPSHLTRRHLENVSLVASSGKRSRYPYSHTPLSHGTFCAQCFCNVTTACFHRTWVLRRSRKVDNVSGVCKWRQRCVYLDGILRVDWSALTKMKPHLSDSILCLEREVKKSDPLPSLTNQMEPRGRVADKWRLHLKEADTKLSEHRTPFQQQLRTIIAVCQLSIHGAVANWCHQELTQ